MRSDCLFGFAQTHPGLLPVEFDGRKLLAGLFGEQLHLVREWRRQIGVLQAKVFKENVDLGLESLQPSVIGSVEQCVPKLLRAGHMVSPSIVIPPFVSASVQT